MYIYIYIERGDRERERETRERASNGGASSCMLHALHIHTYACVVLMEV
jgi:hypothetical protein